MKPCKVAEGKGRFCSTVCARASQRVSPEQQIAINVDRSGGPDACWPWLGKVYATKPYGYFKHRGRSTGAHRTAWELANGRLVPDGLLVRHVVCNNPPCCNPAHLEVGTDSDNSNDMVRAGRQASGVRHGSAKLTEDQVRAIRVRCASGETIVSLAKAFGVSRAAISATVSGKHWRHVKP